MSAVERFCHRAMLIERGDVLEIGEPRRIARRYNELNFGGLVHTATEEGRYGDHAAAEILDAWFEDDAGARITEQAQGEPVTMCMEVSFHTALDDPMFAFNVINEPRHTVFATSTDVAATEPTGHFEAGDRLDGARALRQLARADALHDHALRRAPRRRRRRARPARGPRRAASCTRRAPPAGSPTCRTPTASSAHDHRTRSASSRASSATTCAASSRSRGRSPRPTSSCASTAPCSATRGRSCARSRCSACSGSSSPRSPSWARTSRTTPPTSCSR